MGRKQAVDFRMTTLETWKRFIPVGSYQLREQSREIVIHGAVKVLYGGLDAREDIEKFNSAEFSFFFVDQAEETTLDDVAALRSTLRLSVEDRFPSYKALFTANPAPCWLKDEFISSPKPGGAYIRALPGDNPWLPPEYIETLRRSFKHRPELLRAYIYGDWSSFEGMDRCIRSSWVEASSGREFFPSVPVRLIVCDPARFGDDETCTYVMDDTQVVEEELYGQKDTMHTANVLFTLSRKNHFCPVVVDSIGVGSGIVDRLKEMGCFVIGINSAGASSSPEKYYNLRAEMWHKAGEMFESSSVALRWTDPILRGQLTVPGYSYRGGRILVEPKDNIKKRLSRSPDRGDAYVMGLHALRFLRSHGREGRCDAMEIYRPSGLPAGLLPANSYAERAARQQASRDREMANIW